MKRTKPYIKMTPARKALITHVLSLNKKWEACITQMSNKWLLANCHPDQRDDFERELKNEQK